MTSRRPLQPGARPAADAAATARPASRPAARAGGVAPSRPDRRIRTPRAPRTTSDTRPPRALTVRTLALGLVILVAFVVLAPTLRAFLTQSEQQRRVDAAYASAQADVERLEQELARWRDPAFVQAQARERLSFVMPGEVAYRVIDPQTVEPESASDPRYEGLVEPVAPGPAVPWYLTVWDSVVDAGEIEDDTSGPAGEPGSDQPAP